MKRWIVLGLVVLLLALLVLRERFDTYEEALKDVGQTAGYITPSCAAGFTMSADVSSCERTVDGKKETKDPECPSGSAFVKRGPRGMCEPTGESTQPQPDDTDQRQGSNQAAPVDGGPPAGWTNPMCPSGYVYGEKHESNGQVTKMCERTTDPTCPSGYTLSGGMCIKPGDLSISPTCADGEYDSFEQKCKDVKPANTVTQSSDNTTGGSSANMRGPTSGGGGTGKFVWGPAFSGAGETSTGSPSDSTKTTPYPELLGGLMGKTSTRLEGAGITTPSAPGLGSVMPSDASLGTDANARFFPHSRQPGDMDIVPDPYRLAKNFSTSSYSSKPDPVPFLTDFSAFYK